MPPRNADALAARIGQLLDDPGLRARMGQRGRATVVVQGPLLVSTIGPLDRRLRQVQDSVQYVDLENAGDIDTVGAWTVWRFADGHHAEILNASEQAETQ